MSSNLFGDTARFAVWMWEHYSLDVHLFEDLHSAVDWAEYHQDQGNGSLHSIEEIGVGTLSKSRIEQIIDENNERLRIAAANRPTPKPFARVYIKGPKDKWVLHEWVYTDEALREAMSEVAKFPHDRIRIDYLSKDGETAS